MSILHEALTALLSGITTYKAGTKEILWQDKRNNAITIEAVAAETESYVVRRYWKNEKLWYEHNFQNGKRHGVSKNWYANGQLSYEDSYQNGELHGICKEWHSNGKEHELCRGWYRNGKLCYEDNYINGVLQ